MVEAEEVTCLGLGGKRPPLPEVVEVEVAERLLELHHEVSLGVREVEEPMQCLEVVEGVGLNPELVEAVVLDLDLEVVGGPKPYVRQRRVEERRILSAVHRSRVSLVVVEEAVGQGSPIARQK